MYQALSPALKGAGDEARIPYSRELNLAVTSQIAFARVLVDLNLVVGTGSPYIFGGYQGSPLNCQI